LRETRSLNFSGGEEIEVVDEDVAKLLGSLSLPKVAGGLKYLIHTSPGEGPEVLQGDSAALLDKNGMPKSLVR